MKRTPAKHSRDPAGKRGTVWAVALFCVLFARAQEETPHDPTRLEGVPPRLEAQIVDVTEVRAERELFAATDSPSPERYRLTAPKERPWSFAGVRPQQRRLPPTEPLLLSPSARAEVLPLFPGRVRLDALLSKGVPSLHVAFFVAGDLQDDSYTQGRGSTTAMNLRGRVRTRVGPDTFAGLVEWRGRSSNGLRYDPSAEPDLQRVPQDERFRRLNGTWDHNPSEMKNVRLTADVDVSDYRLEGDSPTAQAYGVRDLSARGRVEFSRELTPRAFDLRMEHIRRKSPKKDAFAAAALTAMFEDRYVPFERGILEYALGLSLSGEPKKGSRAESPIDQEPRFAIPFRVGFHSVQEPWKWRLAVEHSVKRFPLREYVEGEWVVVNPYLPSERAWSATASLERTRRQRRFGFEASYRYVNGLPVWIETKSDASATAWTPVEGLAHLLAQHLYFETAVSRRGQLTADLWLEEVAGNPDDQSNPPTAEEWEHLPYRPQLRASLAYHWEAAAWTADVRGEWVGRRYREPTSKTTLAPYGLFGATVSRDLADALTVVVTGEFSVGERRLFESRLSPELYKVTQNVVGIGIRARL